ncbi:MAG TPA: ATP-binding protein [Bryobacteraceae bacterium]|nr:ATP-binding protein [Bryobacteraceae bacterium]
MAATPWISLLRRADVFWLVLVAGLAAASPTRYPGEIPLLSALAIVQVIEAKVGFFSTSRGSVAANLLKLLLGYFLIGYTGGIESSYYLVLVLPVISAAATLGVIGTVAFTLLACASYLSFLLYIDWTRWILPSDQVRELGLRATFLAIVGFLAYRVAEAKGEEAHRYQVTAQQLAAANRSLKEAEAAVSRSERLAALGQLSAGLAHELRNPLGTIRASAEMLRKNIPAENSVANELAGFISSEVDRTNSLVTRFLEFAKPLALRLHKADLTEVLDRAVTRFQRSPAAVRVSIYKNYSPDIPPFPLDVELMERVVFNLLANAAEASPADGAVTLKTRPVDGTVEISVIDRGAGIDPKHRESIFNPFFTTKPDGVGLGLAIVSKIVDQHGGKMTVESELGRGSVFRVFLPLGGTA